MEQTQKLEELRDMIANMERTLFSARSLLSELLGETPLTSSDSFLRTQTSPSSEYRFEEGKVVHGAFNGQSMTDSEGKTYPVPANYASKSKMVMGDKMKLTITPEGKFIYKQIGPANRKNVLGVLTNEDGQYKVLSGGKEYKLLTASVSFHKASVGDEISILVPDGVESEWGALDSVVPRLGESSF